MVRTPFIQILVKRALYSPIFVRLAGTFKNQDLIFLKFLAMKDILLIETTSLLRNNIEWCIFSFMIRLCHFYFRGSTKLAPHCEITPWWTRSVVLSRDLKSRADHMHPNLIKYESYYILSLYRALNTVNKFVLWSNTFVPLTYCFTCNFKSLWGFSQKESGF